MAVLATDPPVSEEQRKAMWAAAKGESTLGIPQKVGKEFVGADALQGATGHAAGILFVAPSGKVLLLRRSDDEPNFAGHWALPGGNVEDGESPELGAEREVNEEIGAQPGRKKLIDRRQTGTGKVFHTFAQAADEEFVPHLNSEHTGYAWAPMRALPGPMHPAVRTTLDQRLNVAGGADMAPEDWDAFRDGFLKWLSEEEQEPEHADDDLSYDAVFNESDHPREHGKFSSGGGSGGGSEGGWAVQKAGPAGLPFVSDFMKKHPSMKEQSEYLAKQPKDKLQKALDLIEKHKASDVGARHVKQMLEKAIAGRGAQDEALAFDRRPTGMAGEPIRGGVLFALDRESVRSKDVDGRLHVETSHISKACISPYLGKEIPNWEALGLNPNRVYQLFRDPEELQKGAPTFNNLPLLSEHVPVSADAHRSDLVIGSTGSNASFEHPYLDNGLVIWPSDAISDIETGTKRELSSAYRYRADMTPGTYKGDAYDGVMRDIVGNHVALVKEGRAGSDVVVGDSRETLMSKPVILTRKAAMTLGAILAHVKPLIAVDAKPNFSGLSAALDGLTAKNFKQKRAALISGTKDVFGKLLLAKDTNLDDVEKVLCMLEDHEPAERGTQDAMETDPNTGTPIMQPTVDDGDLPSFLKGKLSEDDYGTAVKMMEGAKAKDALEDDDEEKKKKEAEAAKKAEDTVSKAAMDAAIGAAVQKATKDALAAARAVREAEKAVRPYVGELAIAQDSAAGVYSTALKMLGVDLSGVHETAYPAILKNMPVPGSKQHKEPALAQDEAATSDFAKRFPGTSRINLG